MDDRRKKRSDDPLVALHYQLTHAREDGSLDAIVVCDTSGVVVAGAGSWASCEELAAYAPLIAHGVWHEVGPVSHVSRIAEMSRDVDITSVDVDGQEVYVAARGGGRRRPAVEHAAMGVRRILRAA
jgi:hypothetical protein